MIHNPTIIAAVTSGIIDKSTSIVSHEKKTCIFKEGAKPTFVQKLFKIVVEMQTNTEISNLR